MFLDVKHIILTFLPGGMQPALLHDRVRAINEPRLPAVPCVERGGADAPGLRRQKHDVCGGPTTRT
eukprot:44541-Eustigmatos_ZCMA.PRE.1